MTAVAVGRLLGITQSLLALTWAVSISVVFMKGLVIFQSARAHSAMPLGLSP
jgi:hypothetical protein